MRNKFKFSSVKKFYNRPPNLWSFSASRCTEPDTIQLAQLTPTAFRSLVNVIEAPTSTQLKTNEH